MCLYSLGINSDVMLAYETIHSLAERARCLNIQF